MNKMNKKGFTLIEMLVVIAIIAVLVAIIVPTVSKSTTKAKAAADAANLRSIAAQVATDYLEDDAINNSYTVKAAKSNGSYTQIEVFEINGELQCYYTDGTNYLGVKELSDTAEDGSTLTPVTTVAGSSLKVLG